MIGRRATYVKQTAPTGNEEIQPPGTIVALRRDAYVTIERDDGTLDHVHQAMIIRLEPLPPAARDAEAALEQAMLACALALEAVRRGR